MHWQEAVAKSNTQRAYRHVKGNSNYPSDGIIIRFSDGVTYCTMCYHFDSCFHVWHRNVEGYLDWRPA